MFSHAADDSRHIYYFDPAAPEQQERLYDKYVASLPAEVLSKLEPLSSDTELKDLLSTEQPLAGSPGYWNRRWNKKVPPYYPEWLRQEGEDDDVWRARTKVIDEKAFFLAVFGAIQSL